MQLFPNLSSKKRTSNTNNQEPNKKKPRNNKGGAKKPRTEEVQLSTDCAIDHDKATSYRKIDSPYYFQDLRKYHLAKCRGCGKPFASDYNLENCTVPDSNPSNYIPLPNTKGGCTFACSHWDLDKSNCGNMYCAPCYHDCADSGSRRRTTRH